MPCSGPLRPRGVLVGESPGKDEAREGVPFVGKTGAQLDVELNAAGLARGDLLLINAVACQPSANKMDGDMRRAVKACAPFFRAQLGEREANHAIALVMGKWAGVQYAGKLPHGGIADGRGFIRMGHSAAPYILTWHPTYAFFYNPWSWADFTNDVRKFARLVRGERREEPRALVTNPTVEHLIKLVAEGLPIACDTEYGTPETYKDPNRAPLRTIAFGNKNWGLSFGWPLAPPGLASLAKAVIAGSAPTIYQNGAWADHRVLRAHGFQIGAWEDTMDLRKAMASTSRLGLGYLATLYDDPGPWKEDSEADDAKGMAFTDDFGDLLRYNAQDAVETARVWDGLVHEPEFVEARVQRLYALHKELGRIAANMHTAGLMVDAEEQARLRAELSTLARDRGLLFTKLVGVDVSVAPDTMRALLYERYARPGLPCFKLPVPGDPISYTDSGTIKVDQARLLNVITGAAVPEAAKEIISAYWQAQAPRKALSTFVDSDLVRSATGADGRLRAGWNPRGPDTGRWSCSDPNIQNLSEKKGEDALGGNLPNVRRLYRAAPNRVLVHADYSQLELRVRAAVMGDTVLAAHLCAGDVYTLNGRDWFNIPAGIELKKSARKAAKTIHLASQYAAGVAKIHVQALKQDRSFKFATTRVLHSGFLKTYRRTREWWEEEYAHVAGSELRRGTGYSASRILDRRRYYPARPDITEVVNYPIQATAADIANLALVALDRELHGEHHILLAGAPWDREPVTQLHDAFDVECYADEAKDIAAVMSRIMTAPVEIEGTSYSFPVEIKTGQNWSEV